MIIIIITYLDHFCILPNESPKRVKDHDNHPVQGEQLPITLPRNPISMPFLKIWFG